MRHEQHVLIDVREDHEWTDGRLPGAMHLGRGIIERDIEALFADRSTPIVCYCGGGYRSVLVCDSLQKMGYTNTVSLAGGFRGWQDAGLPVEKDGE
jgi:rhodanese-related sulfurtransferase